MSTYTVYCERRWRVTIPDPDGDIRLTAVAQFGKFDANFTPHFSITGELRQGENHRFGAIHDDLIKYLPETKQFCRLHLSDHLGKPMHAYANAAYFAGHTAYPDAKDLRMLAKHLRVIPSHAEILVLQADDMVKKEHKVPVKVWETLCEWHQIDRRWFEQAKALLALFTGEGKTINRIPTEFIPKDF